MEVRLNDLNGNEIIDLMETMTIEQKQVAITKIPTNIIWNEMEQRVLRAEKFEVDFKELTKKYME